MSNREFIQSFSNNLFWDTDPSTISMETSSRYIIQRVLEYGQMNDWRLINQYYGLQKIVEECKQMRTLDPVCLSFICTISHTKEEDYRCYHFRQSFPKLWNSYSADADPQPMPYMFQQVDWDAIKDEIKRQVEDYNQKHL